MKTINFYKGTELKYSVGTIELLVELAAKTRDPTPTRKTPDPISFFENRLKV